METIQSALSQSESELSSLAKAYERVHAEASAFLALGLQWQEIEEHLDSIRVDLLTRLEELRVRERELDERDKQFKAREEQMSRIESLEEYKEGKSELESVRLLIHESNEELENRNKSFEEAGILLGKKNREVEEVEELIREKEMEFESVDNQVRKMKKKVNKWDKNVKKVSKKIECKKMKLKKAEGRLNECCDDIEWKEKQLFDMEWDIEKNKKDYDISVGKLKWAQNLEDKCNRKLEMKKERVKSMQRTLSKYADDLKLKESGVKEVDVKVKEFSLHKKEMEDWSLKLEAKQKELEGLAEKLELTESCFEAFRPRVEELNLIEERVGVCVDEVQLKLEKLFDSLEEKRQEGQKHLDEQQKSVQERVNELELKERRLDERAKEVELKERRVVEQANELVLKELEAESIRKAAEEQVKSKEKPDRFPCVVKIEQFEHNPATNDAVPLRASNRLSINRDGRGLQLFMNEHLKRVDSVGREMSALLQGSVDPAGLVLEAMQGFYPTSLIGGNSEADVDLRIIRRSCIILLQQLKSLSPKISSQVRDEAMRLAADWKTKMTVATENRLEVLGFLRLVTTYELTSTYDAEELQSLLAIIAKAEQSADMEQALGITDKAPVGSTISSPIIVDEAESSVAKRVATIPSPDGRWVMIEHLNDNDVNEIFAMLHKCPDPAKLVLDSMQISFAQLWGDGDVCLNPTVMMGYITLLDKIRVFKNIGTCAKEDARKLAVQWKARMRIDAGNPLESLLFLQFIATYEILKGCDIVNLLLVISQHEPALELCRTLGFADKIPDFIRSLIERKQLIGALRFIFFFKLIDKFPPVQLLKEQVCNAKKYVSDVCRNQLSLSEKEKLVDDLLGDLRVVHECIEVFNLKSEFPSADIEKEALQLEQLKEYWKRSLPSLESSVNQPDQRKRRRLSAGTSAPIFQPGQQIEQSYRQTAVSTAMGTSSSSSSLPYEGNRVPGQIGMTASDRVIGANIEGQSLLAKNGQRV